MTSPAALPGAALRVMRTAAGRRALQVVVLVGGLFALGFLCGERASAAEGVPTVTSHEVASVAQVAPVTSGVRADGVRSLTRDAVERLVIPRTEADVHPTAPPQTQPAEAEAHGSAPRLPDLTDTSLGGKVVQPVGELVETVTEQLADAQAEAQWPALPSLPALPAVPELPVPPVLPGQTLPAPVTAAPQPGSPADGSNAGHGSDSPAGSDSSTSPHKARASRVGDDYGPSYGDGSPVTGTAAKADRHRAARSGGYVPAHPAPAGDPDGVLAHRSGVDNGSPRHGDAQAVSLNDRAPLRLVPGGVVRTDAGGTRDRHRDIPVSPA
ncbi:hypothetical protein ACIGMX_10635 [Streptomyces aquilus]|uniref:hypothetical protein n=1 Tax=Streptomyces aquilus TaxID=2548456 RepID=UPI0037D61205